MTNDHLHPLFSDLLGTYYAQRMEAAQMNKRSNPEAVGEYCRTYCLPIAEAIAAALRENEGKSVGRVVIGKVESIHSRGFLFQTNLGDFEIEITQHAKARGQS